MKPDKDCPQVLINLENTHTEGFDYDDILEHPERIWLKGYCDDIIKKLAKDVGWDKEFSDLCQKKEKIEEKKQKEINKPAVIKKQAQKVQPKKK